VQRLTLRNDARIVVVVVVVARDVARAVGARTVRSCSTHRARSRDVATSPSTSRLRGRRGTVRCGDDDVFAAAAAAAVVDVDEARARG